VILLIDGRSGSGKSELASALADLAQVVRLDDLYPGWDGLEAGSAAVPGVIQNRRYQRWDWSRSEPAEWIELDAGPLVIEGCGALSAANRDLADFGLWVDYPTAGRRERALAREPEYGPHWDEWAAQEQLFIDSENPRSLADFVVDGSDVTVGLARWRTMLAHARVGE
jgi:energy-coupling factor transporter ATP-binding protein EcfA2